MPKSLRGPSAALFLQTLGQNAGVKDIDAHRCQIAGGLLRFFMELNDLILGVRLHDAKPVRFLDRHRHDGDGQVSALTLMEVQHRAVVHLIDVVAGENQCGVGVVFGEEVQIL